MIKNIWAYLDKLQVYFKANTSINTLFEWRIYAWKPIGDLQGKSLFFSLVNNSEQVRSDVSWTLRKRGTFEMFFIGGGKWVPEVEIYEALDSFSNAFCTDCTQNIELWDITDSFVIHSIEEGNQSWILRDAKDNPFLIGTYTITYTYRY